MLYLLADIAFVPLEIFLVTMVMDRLLESREKEGRLKKMHMLIGLYYQELGLSLLKTLVLADGKRADFQGPCEVGMNWQTKDFRNLEKWLGERKMEINPEAIDYDQMLILLNQSKELMVSLIANPTLLEHENFSELLMAVNHLRDELTLRNHMKGTENYKPDYKHWKVDMERVYHLSAVQWIRYIEHLKNDYPFLYNAARVTNPFEEASLIESYERVRGAS